MRRLREDLTAGEWVKTTEPLPTGSGHDPDRKVIYVEPGGELPGPLLLAEGEVDRLQALGVLEGAE